jgi:hypothetical protein
VVPLEVAVENFTKNWKYSAIVDYGQPLQILSVAILSYLGGYGTPERLSSATQRIYGRGAHDTSTGQSPTTIRTALGKLRLQNAKEMVVVAWATGALDYHALVRVLDGNMNVRVKANDLDMKITRINALQLVRMMTKAC